MSVCIYFLSWLSSSGQLSESEAEMDGDHNEVTLPQRLASRGNMDNAKSALRLIEVRVV